MTLASLHKVKAQRVLGIDASTNSVAFCLIENNKPVRWGKIEFVGADIYEKIYDAKIKMKAMLPQLESDYIVVEGAVFVKSPDAVIKLSYVYGVVIAELMSSGAKVITISPTAWQSHIGNKNPTKMEKDKLKFENPGKTESWYKAKMREIRKQRTVNWANTNFNINLDDFDVADSVGIAFYGYKQLTER